MTTLVSLRNLHKKYQRGPESLDVLHGINLDIAEGDFIGVRHLPPLLVTRGEESLPEIKLTPGTTVDEAERRLILLTLDHTRNNKTRAAEILGISLKTLHNKLNRMKEEGA